MERETLEPLSFDAVQTLYVLGCPQGRGDQRLGLAPSKKGGSVRPGEDSGLTGDWPYLLQAPTVGPAPLIQNQSPHLLFLDPLQDFLYLKLNLDRFTGEGQQGLIRDLLPPGLPGLLEGRQPPNRFACKCRDPIQQGGINRRRGERDFGPTHQIGQGLLHLDDGGNSLLAKGNGFEEAFLRNFVGPRLYHDHALFGPGDDQVQVRLLHLFVGRIQNQAPSDPADPNAPDRPQEGNGRDGQRRRGPHHGEHVRIVLPVSGENRRDDLDILAEALRKERTDGSVNEAGSYFLLIPRLSLTLEEAPGDHPGSIRSLLIIHREGEKVDPLPRVFRRHCRHQDHRIPVLNPDRPVRLPCYPASLHG